MSPAECVTVTFGCLDPPRPVADSVGDVAAHGGSANSHRGRPPSPVDGHVCRTRRESPKPFIARPGSRRGRSSGCRVASLRGRCDARAVPGVGNVDGGGESPAGWHTRATRRHWPKTPPAARLGRKPVELSRDASVGHPECQSKRTSSDPSRLASLAPQGAGWRRARPSVSSAWRPLWTMEEHSRTSETVLP